jgi:hypothetical protein
MTLLYPDGLSGCRMFLGDPVVIVN